MGGNGGVKGWRKVMHKYRIVPVVDEKWDEVWLGRFNEKE